MEDVSKMSTRDLAIRMAEKNNHLTIEQCEEAIKIVLHGIADGISRGERTEIRGFGSFKPVVSKPGTRRNPKTGDRVTTGYRGKAHFKPGKELKNRVNKHAA